MSEGRKSNVGKQTGYFDYVFRSFSHPLKLNVGMKTKKTGLVCSLSNS
jgi:hypothetical protein